MQTTPNSNTSKDVFQDSVTQIAKTASKQRKLVFVSVAITIAVVAAVTLYLSKRSARLDEGQAAFFIARKTLESELNTVRESLPKPPAPPADKNAKKDPKAPPPPAPQASLEFERFNVPAKLTKSVAELEKVGKEFNGVLPGYEAYLLLGQTFLEHGGSPQEIAQATTYFSKAADAAPSTEHAVVAYSAQAFALETEGKHAEAGKSFERVLNYGNTPMQAEAMKGLARNHELQKDAKQARSTYERIVSTFPGTEHARFAQMKLSELPSESPTEKK